MFTAGTIFFVITCICLRRHSTAAITRGGGDGNVCITEAAYDNPTYKVSKRLLNFFFDTIFTNM